MTNLAEEKDTYAFVDWFLDNMADSVIVPYSKQNQRNKLTQLARANNREFKTAFAC